VENTQKPLHSNITCFSAVNSATMDHIHVIRIRICEHLELQSLPEFRNTKV